MVCNRMLISPDMGNCQESHKTARSQGGRTDPWLCMYQERKGNMLRAFEKGVCALIASFLGSKVLFARYLLMQIYFRKVFLFY